MPDLQSKPDRLTSVIDATVIARTISQLYVIDGRSVQPEPANMVALVEHVLHEAEKQLPGAFDELNRSEETT